MFTKRKVSYAQNREDIILEGFFEDIPKGFYVDIGAYDPDEDSVTKLFYLKGWHGINVEPQPDRFKFFTEKRPHDININVGISDKTSKLVLRSYSNQGLSTFSDTMKEVYEKESDSQTDTFKDITVQVTTLKLLFERYAKLKINFLKVDVEGLEYEVLAGNDWEKYRPEVICIEANHVEKDWRSLLRSEGYNQVFFDGLNEYYADSKTGVANKFDYVSSVIFREPIINYHLLKDIDLYDKHIKWLEASLEEARAENESTNAYAQELQSQLSEIATLGRHIKHRARHNLSKVDRKILNKLSRKSDFKASRARVSYKNRTAKSLLSAAATYDKQNFTDFAYANQRHFLFPAYTTTRKQAYKATRKVKSTVKRVIRR